ncbi:unnamed protein product, partial [Mesorhabditis belari]|uniref:Programmed cell death protein 4 n=1 Tax=Mesorhabditis belari TaxID=2138241 RepID=A0AAF3J7G0_9BILA
MPYDRRPRQIAEDPEVVAEREYNLVHGIAENAKSKNAMKGCDVVEMNNGEMEVNEFLDNPPIAVPISPASSDSGNVSTASSLHKTNSWKEEKADRKKRCRGVSGSSIKKDGGRFELGFESYEDDELFSDGEWEDLKKLNIKDYDYDPEETFTVSQAKNEIYPSFCSHLDGQNLGKAVDLVSLFVDCRSEEERITALYSALCQIVEEELKSESGVGRISEDPCGEYRIAVMVAGLINEMYPDVNNFATHLKNACFPDMEAVPAFVNSIIETAKTFVEFATDEIKGEMQGCPDEAVDAVVDAMTGGSFDRDVFKDLCEGLELFHVEIIKRALVCAVNSMDLQVMHRVEKAILQFASYSGEKFDCTYRFALSRVLAQAEKVFGDAVAWPNALRLVVAGVVENEQCWAYYSGPGRNWKKIPKATVTLCTDSPGSSHLMVLQEVPKNNIFLLKEL